MKKLHFLGALAAVALVSSPTWASEQANVTSAQGHFVGGGRFSPGSYNALKNNLLSVIFESCERGCRGFHGTLRRSWRRRAV